MKKISLLLSLFILVSCAHESSEDLTIYTSRQPQLLEPIIETFYQETGIKVNLLSGNAQELMGPVIEVIRSDVFLACKTNKRDKENSKIELEDSLKKLRTCLLYTSPSPRD